MSARAGVADQYKKNLRTRSFQTLCTAWVLCLSGCVDRSGREPFVEYSGALAVTDSTREGP
jgi:hypothetical protein